MTNSDNYLHSHATIADAIQKLQAFLDDMPAPEYASMSDARDAAQLAQALERLTAGLPEVQE